ncbi:Retrovirus-related Pol polyprotein from transposon RE1 [Vitis vinifera]|uniref:Retrovirus-related Pol polyprotein from transposon RE1 n=1 Tax=Vitis vinifera TaxID=29760 RepID=A0A438FWI8_VITVI|nr:Retrovirus-related Pol polyprotein from transposon RE1 [Vitis vinifera]
MEHRANVSASVSVAYNCPKKFCNYCKKQGHIISACPIRLERKQGTAYHASTDTSSYATLPVVSSVVPIPAPIALANLNTLTPKMFWPISAVGDLSSSLTDVFMSPDLSTNDQVLGKMIAKEPKVGRLFPLHVSPSTIIPSLHLFSYACNVVGSGHKMWHRRLGHLNFDDFFQSKWIISQRSCPSTPQQNGVAERKNHHLLDVLFGHSPLYSDLRTFGCVCFVHLPTHEQHKLTAQFVKCAFLGYTIPHKGYVCCDPHAHRIRVSRNVIFFENQYFFPSHVELPSASVSLLPSFSESLTILERFKPGFVYERHSRHEFGSTSSMPSFDLDLTPDPAPAFTTLRLSTHIFRPPDWLKQVPRAWFEKFAVQFFPLVLPKVSMILPSSSTRLRRDTAFVETPMEINVKYRKDEGDLLDDPILYRRLVGSLIYLTTTRPDISYVVHQVSQFMTSPWHLYLVVVQLIIRYLRGSPTRGLFFPTGSSLQLVAYSDAD